MNWRNVRGMRELHVHMGMFDFGVNVVIGPKEKLLKYVMHKLEVEHGSEDHRRLDRFISGGKRGCHFSWRGFCPIVWIPRIPRTPEEHGTLSHESVHAVYSLFDWVEMPITQDTEEVMTHATSFLVSSVLGGRRGR